MIRIFDRYEYDPGNIIGRGGMGTVYRGVNCDTQTPVAIKYLDPTVVKGNPDLVQRFQREGQALRDLNHPNIVKIIEAGQCADDHYLVMEYVPGGSLRDVLDAQPKLIVQRALYIALDLADALTRAHRLDILHRDIKPANVLLADDGTPRLTDFGVARVRVSTMTEDGSLVGTLAYLSPESLTGGDVDERHDIWAFGVLLYEMLAGERPFHHEQIAPLIQSITTQPVPDLEMLRPDVPVALVDLIYRMLEKDPGRRVRSSRRIGAELEAIIHGADAHLQLSISTSEARFGGSTTPIGGVSSSTFDSNRLNRAGLHNFPAEVTPFVGRKETVETVTASLRDPEKRLITLVGPGGAGKTRVSMAAARAASDYFPDGVYFVPLEGVDDPENVPSKIADAMDFQFSGADDPVSQLMVHLKDKNVLFVLDNLEHLIDGAGYISEELKQLPGVQILATSRERLRLRGEQVHAVGSMRVPPLGLNDSEQVCEYPAVQLFENSATRTAPDFELNAETAPHVTRIIHLVQGMPLAIELAAGWLEMLPVDEIAGEIESNLDFLETDLRDVPERHRSIRAVFDYSYNLMTDAERDAFIKLSLFRGGFGRDAAQKITDTSLRTLTALVNKSLLFRAPDGRYAVHKLLRQYAEENFEHQCDDAHQVREQYVNYYAQFLHDLRDAFAGKRGASATDAIEAEIENVRHAWRLALADGLFGALDKMLFSMQQYYINRGMFAEAVPAFEALFETLRERGQDDTPVYWHGRNLYAMLLGRRGDYRQSEAVAREVVTYFQETDEKQQYGMAGNALSYALMMQGQYDESRELQKRVIRLIEAQEQPQEVNMTYAIALGNLGYLEFLAGNLERALSIYERLTNELYTMKNSPIGYAFGKNNTGEIVQAMGDYERAEELYQTAYDTFKSMRHRRGMAFTTNNLAGIALTKDDLEAAKSLYMKAYRLNREVSDRAGIGHSLSAMANIAFFEQRYEEAYRYFKEALELRKETGDRIGYGHSLREVGMCLYLLNRVDEARPYYQEAEKVGRELNHPFIQAQATAGLGVIRLFDGEKDKAIQTFRSMLALVADEESSNRVMFITLFMVIATFVMFERADLDVLAAQLLGFLQVKLAVLDESLQVATSIISGLEITLRERLGDAYRVELERGRALDTIDDVFALIASSPV